MRGDHEDPPLQRMRDRVRFPKQRGRWVNDVRRDQQALLIIVQADAHHSNVTGSERLLVDLSLKRSKKTRYK